MPEEQDSKISEQTKIVLSVGGIVSLLGLIIGATVWVTSLWVKMEPIPAKVMLLEKRATVVESSIRDACRALRIIQRYTVPPKSRQELDCIKQF